MSEIGESLKELRHRIIRLKDSLDIVGRLEKKVRIEREMEAADFWNNPEKAAETVSKLKRVRAVVDPYVDLESLLDDAEAMAELAEEDGSKEALEESRKAVVLVETRCDKLELAVLLGGPHDHRNAFLQLQAGAGGTESCDWAQILLRMYLRWCERNDFDAEIIDEQPHEEAGIKSATVLVSGQFAYGYLHSEQGVHRLVRISPFDAANRRHTSFCSVDVVPEFDETVEVEINPDDLRTDTYRAGGAGGQHINKTDSAVRITHLPTNIVVQCQNERSQHQNRSTAMKMLRAKLFALEEQKREAEIRGLQGDKGDIAWGHQIRSYVLQPYTLVKDNRTGTEKGNAAGVLDGDLNEFIQAFLRYSASGASGKGKK
ncbi:MAG: peptide chain release factor 2 [Planctomycetota bacterium]